MNYSIIKAIFKSGCISENMPVTEEHKKAVKKLFEFEEKIKKFLPEEDGENLMRDYSFLQSELDSEIESTGFAEGFKTGLLVGAEVFGNTNQKV